MRWRLGGRVWGMAGRGSAGYISVLDTPAPQNTCRKLWKRGWCSRENRDEVRVVLVDYSFRGRMSCT